ncbi:hypothetical protein C7212DRAFT_361396 [Tuber magnatum]|uniref:Uncharacterized protein n=1 Tax=Tuber magnatum TaxID=42249 RepID=A0A317SZN3_9PEZI|nr:hypothetical protein C7212DRAFT_361396 [Tuber magnatum]
MSAPQTPETPPPPPEEVQDLLKEIANLLCPSHQHELTVPYITPGEVTGHSMMIACRHEGNITWQVGISANTLVEVIRLCKIHSTSGWLGHPSVITFETLSAWEGDQCDDILWLLRIGHLKEGWWENNPSRLSDERRGYGQEHYDAGSGASGSHSYVAYSGPIPDLSAAPPSDKGKDYDSGMIPE